MRLAASVARRDAHGASDTKVATASDTLDVEAVTARGRVTAQLPFGAAGWMDAALPGALPLTVYARFGEGPVLGLLLVMLAGLAAARFVWPRRFGA